LIHSGPELPAVPGSVANPQAEPSDADSVVARAAGGMPRAERGGMVSNSRRAGKAPPGMAIDRQTRGPGGLQHNRVEPSEFHQLIIGSLGTE